MRRKKKRKKSLLVVELDRKVLKMFVLFVSFSYIFLRISVRFFDKKKYQKTSTLAQVMSVECL